MLKSYKIHELHWVLEVCQPVVSAVVSKAWSSSLNGSMRTLLGRAAFAPTWMRTRPYTCSHSHLHSLVMHWKSVNLCEQLLPKNLSFPYVSNSLASAWSSIETRCVLACVYRHGGFSLYLKLIHPSLLAVFFFSPSSRCSPPSVLLGPGLKQLLIWLQSAAQSLRLFSLWITVFVLQVCGGGALDSRAEQCAAFNTQEFMGRFYNWEPFTEGEWTHLHSSPQFCCNILQW